MFLSTQTSLSGSAGGSDWFLTVLMVSVFQPIVNQMRHKAKKYLITTEKHEIFIVRNGHRAISGFCPECKTEVELLNLDSAVTYSGESTRELFELLDGGAIHSIETKSGHLLVCRNSLLAR